MQQIVPMESPSEIQGRHVDPAHFGETCREKPVLSEPTQNWDPLPWFASGTYQRDWRSQIYEATSQSFERSFFSVFWGKNEYCWAREDQEQAKQLAYTRRAPPARHLEATPLALMLFHFEWYHHDTIALIVSLALRRRRTTRCQQARRSLTTWLAHALPTRLHGAYMELDVMLSAMAKDSDSIVSPDSEKKLLYVKCGLRTKSYTQSRTPRISLF